MSYETVKVHEIVTCMETYGGSFVKALAETWYCADPVNKARIQDAFQDIFHRYGQMVIDKETTS